MVTDFFQQQDSARHKTTLLVVYFVLAVLTLTGLVYLLCAFLFLSLGGESGEASSLWDPTLFLGVAVGVSAVIAGASLLKTVELAAGGKTVALMLGGRQVLGTTDDLKQRRLLNVVEEMAIASGVPVPPVYLLPEETGINAFAAGHATGDAVVAVSHGCLDYLSRDELQGVVAHEFSHILNGDMRLNIRLLGLIYGILALSTIGRVLMAATARGRSSRREDNGRQGVWLLGLGLFVLGLGGAFFGRLIQAAVSRQREYLADASAVQFTRNPNGIGGALKKIGGLKAGPNIANPRAEEISHMFFADALSRRRISDWFATHPPLTERIKRLDPLFDGKFPAVQPVGVSAEAPKGPPRAPAPPLIPGMPHPALGVMGLAPEAAAAHVGQVTPEEVTYAAGLHTNIPDPVRIAAQEPFSARALVYCLLLDPQPAVRQAQLAQLRAQADTRDYEHVLRLADTVRSLPDASRLPVLELAMPALREMSPRQHQVFRAQVDELIRADQQVSIFEYVLRCVLSRYLDADFNRVRPRARYGSPAQLGPPMAKVLTLLAWEGQPEEAKARAAFQIGMRSFLGDAARAYHLLPREQCPLREFDAALQILAEAVPSLKRRVLMSCTACILADRQVTVREGELLRAISATLDCPMPPLEMAAR
jgi:Zn-dependent protease with chaperone function